MKPTTVLSPDQVKPGTRYQVAILPAFVTFQREGRRFQTLSNPPYNTAAMNCSYIRRALVMDLDTWQMKFIAMRDVVEIVND